MPDNIRWIHRKDKHKEEEVETKIFSLSELKKKYGAKTKSTTAETITEGFQKKNKNQRELKNKEYNGTGKSSHAFIISALTNRGSSLNKYTTRGKKENTYEKENGRKTNKERYYSCTEPKKNERTRRLDINLHKENKEHKNMKIHVDININWNENEEANKNKTKKNRTYSIPDAHISVKEHLYSKRESIESNSDFYDTVITEKQKSKESYEKKYYEQEREQKEEFLQSYHDTYKCVNNNNKEDYREEEYFNDHSKHEEIKQKGNRVYYTKPQEYMKNKREDQVYYYKERNFRSLAPSTIQKEMDKQSSKNQFSYEEPDANRYQRTFKEGNNNPYLHQTNFKRRNNLILAVNRLHELLLHKLYTEFIYFKNRIPKLVHSKFKKFVKVKECKVIPYANSRQDHGNKNKKDTETKTRLFHGYNKWNEPFKIKEEKMNRQQVQNSSPNPNKYMNLKKENIENYKDHKNLKFQLVNTKYEHNSNELFKPILNHYKSNNHIPINRDNKIHHIHENFVNSTDKNRLFHNTLIDNFMDVNLYDQKRKKKYLKFFVILLSLFLKKYFYKNFSHFFQILGMLKDRHNEKRGLTKYLNTKTYALLVLEKSIKKKEREWMSYSFGALQKNPLGKKKKEVYQRKETHMGIRFEQNQFNSFGKKEPIIIEKPQMFDDSYIEMGLSNNSVELRNFKTAKSSVNMCFGKPKIYYTDDFALYYKQKKLREQDEIYQKCLLRSKSDSLMYFLKFSKQNLLRSMSKNDQTETTKDELKSSTLLERFYTAAYPVDQTNEENLMDRRLRSIFQKSNINLQFSNYEPLQNFNSNFHNSIIIKRGNGKNSHENTVRVHVDQHEKHKKWNVSNLKEKENEVNSFSSNVPSDLSISREGSFELNKQLSHLKISGMHRDPSITDKTCRIIFKTIKKKLKINYINMETEADDLFNSSHLPLNTKQLNISDLETSLSSINPMNTINTLDTFQEMDSFVDSHKKQIDENATEDLSILTKSDLYLIKNLP